MLLGIWTALYAQILYNKMIHNNINRLINSNRMHDREIFELLNKIDNHDEILKKMGVETKSAIE